MATGRSEVRKTQSKFLSWRISLILFLTYLQMSLHDIRIFFLLNLWNSDFFLDERTGFFLGLEGTYALFHYFHFSRGLTYLLGLEEEAFRLCYFSFNEFLMGRNICWGSVRMWEILVNEQGWISYVSYVFISLWLCSMHEDLLLSFPYAISFVYTTCFTCTF